MLQLEPSVSWTPSQSRGIESSGTFELSLAARPIGQSVDRHPE
jgi:hypothetical protein